MGTLPNDTRLSPFSETTMSEGLTDGQWISKYKVLSILKMSKWSKMRLYLTFLLRIQFNNKFNKKVCGDFWERQTLGTLTYEFRDISGYFKWRKISPGHKVHNVRWKKNKKSWNNNTLILQIVFGAARPQGSIIKNRIIPQSHKVSQSRYSIKK